MPVQAGVMFRSPLPRAPFWTRLLQECAGASAIEYGILASLVGIAAVGAIEGMGGSFTAMLQTVADAVATAVPSGAGGS